MPTKGRWDVTRKNRLYFSCLGSNHVENNFPRSRVCGIDGCKELHKHILYVDKSTSSSNSDGKEKGSNRTINLHPATQKGSRKLIIAEIDNVCYQATKKYLRLFYKLNLLS